MTEPLAEAEVAVRAGDPKRALQSLTAAVKAAPSNPKLRIFLAQLLCVTGAWERAHTQLNVVADMDASAIPMREMVGHALRCELVREAVFAGKRSPMVFGQPDEWLALLIESLLQAGQGASEMSHQLAGRAFDAAPATAGLINGEPFEWIADADSRLGPVLEAMINGRYYWIPFSRLSRVSIDTPTDLRDRVWLAANIQFANGGEAIAMIPTRYPGSQKSDDGQILMAAKTEWLDIGADRFAGIGQRVIVTDQGEHDILELRLLELGPAPGEVGGEAAAHMAELNSRDRLQPSLLDRLIDNDPQSRSEGLDARVLTRQQLRAAVLRDLSWLFNDTRQEPEVNSTRQDEVALWRSHDLARRSVLNYGMPSFSGITLSSMDTATIERETAEAIRNFEPRIDPDSLSVEVNVDYASHHNSLQLVIRGKMWSQPVPLELLLSADVDIETGNTSVRDLRG